jgi:polysaccharide deacetylase family protein (PEP-CTERM system associated)
MPRSVSPVGTGDSLPPPLATEKTSSTILSFDIEEHHRIEAAAGLAISAQQKEHYCARMDVSTRWILDTLAEKDIRATFFIVGEIARDNPTLVRDIHRAGHEVASHGWDHRSVHHFTPETFRLDIIRSKVALEQVTGEPVVGYRAPTFSVTRRTAWALDILAEVGMHYDSSIFPVRHDRYGIPTAPRGPFLARGGQHHLLELPPATLRLLYTNLPVGGGGYFRLFPLFVLNRGLAQLRRTCRPAIAMLYFHPWEFDTDQQQLPLGRLGRFRTYVGIGRAQVRLRQLLARHSFVRAVDLVKELNRQRHDLPRFDLVSPKLTDTSRDAPQSSDKTGDGCKRV